MTRYTGSVLGILRRNKWFFLSFSLAGLLLRLWFVRAHPVIAGDSLVYGDMAKNLLQQGIYGVTDSEGPVPTYIRLPGYPGFLALTWMVAGLEHYTAVLRAQVVIDLLTCFVIAALAFRLFSNSQAAAYRSEPAAKAAFALAALCPFTAMYTAAALTETATIFSTAVALWCGLALLQNIEDGQPWRGWAVGCGAATAAAILLRPDSGLLLVPIPAALALLALRGHARRAVAAGLLVSTVALAPLLPWAVRNWRVFHEFQPLAPYHANAPGEFVALGFDRWTGTWLADFISVMDVSWKIGSETPGETADIRFLPNRAFDTAEERARTAALFDAYNQANQLTPEIDRGFAELAQQRTARHPFRSHVVLPLARLADMWLRPRNETMDLDLDWWVGRDTRETVESVGLGLLNLAYLGLAVASLRRLRAMRGALVLCTFMLVRSALLWQLTNPEPRYTLECYPAVIALAATAVASSKFRFSRKGEIAQD